MGNVLPGRSVLALLPLRPSSSLGVRTKLCREGPCLCLAGMARVFLAGMLRLGLFLSWQPPLSRLKMSLNAKALSKLSITPALADFPFGFRGHEASLCALPEVSGQPKSKVSFHGWLWLKHIDAPRLRDAGQELCPGSTGDAASPPSLGAPSLLAASRSSDPTNASEFVPLPTRIVPAPFRVAGSSSGTGTQGCSVFSGGNHSNGAASPLSCWQFAFSSCIKVDPLQLLSTPLPAMNGNAKSSPAPCATFQPIPRQVSSRFIMEKCWGTSPQHLGGDWDSGYWSFSLTQINKCKWDKIRGFLTLVVKRSLSRLKTVPRFVLFCFF